MLELKGPAGARGLVLVGAGRSRWRLAETRPCRSGFVSERAGAAVGASGVRGWSACDKEASARRLAAAGASELAGKGRPSALLAACALGRVERACGQAEEMRVLSSRRRRCMLRRLEEHAIGGARDWRSARSEEAEVCGD